MILLWWALCYQVANWLACFWAHSWRRKSQILSKGDMFGDSKILAFESSSTDAVRSVELEAFGWSESRFWMTNMQSHSLLVKMSQLFYLWPTPGLMWSSMSYWKHRIVLATVRVRSFKAIIKQPRSHGSAGWQGRWPRWAGQQNSILGKVCAEK